MEWFLFLTIMSLIALRVGRDMSGFI